MSDYTVKNLQTDVENAAARFGIEDMQARFARNALGLRTFGFSYQKLAPNYRQGFGHRHERQEEAYLVLSGSGRVKVEDDIVDLRPWDAIRIAPHLRRQFEAGPDGLAYIAMGGGEGGDAETVEEWWKD